MSDDKATNLYTALLAAQRSMGKVKKDASNPAFRSKYATLQSVLDTIEEPLHANGLLLVQRLQYDRIGRDGSAGDGTPILITELIHAASGDKIESVVAVACKDPHDPQKVGGALTYYRRYSLLALLNIAPEDDDGNAAAQPRQAPRQQPASSYRASAAVESLPPAAPLAPNAVRIPCAECHHAGTCRTEGYCQAAAVAQSKPQANLDTDQVLTILGEMADAKEPWHEIKRYADDQGHGRTPDDALRIHDKLRAIASGRKAKAPASHAG